MIKKILQNWLLLSHKNQQHNKKSKQLLPLVALLMLTSTGVSFAQNLPDTLGIVDALSSTATVGGGAVSGRMIQLFGLLTILSIAPGLLMMVTSFTRFAIAFSLLRSGLGLQAAPANLVMISLSLFMTFYVMAPSFNQAWQNGVEPLMENRITEQQAAAAIAEPFRDFMMVQVREKDLVLFADLASPSFDMDTEAGLSEKVDFRILIPAFMISELKRGFEIGFLIVLPFLVIDLIVSTLTMSMGMMMLPPTVISLPFKILFFVLIDGWNLLVGSLIRSFT